MPSFIKEQASPCAILFLSFLILQKASADKPFCNYYDEKKPYDACFGECKLYNPKWEQNFFEHCGQDIDRNGVLAEDACEECGKCVEDKKNTAGQEVYIGGCKPPDEATKACNMEPWFHTYGGCETYRLDHEDSNFPYCAEDKGENGVTAEDACPECGLCYSVPTASPGPGASKPHLSANGSSTAGDTPTTPKPVAPVPSPTLDPNKPVCKFYDKKNPFDDCFGECKLYNPKWEQNFFEHCGQDIDRNGVLAEDACEECGKCVEDKKNTAGQEVYIGGCKPPDEATKACNMEPWFHTYGGCETYRLDHEDSNFPYCAEDKGENGVTAEDACPECGLCYSVPTVSPGPSIATTPKPVAPVPSPTLDPNKPVCKFYDKKNPFDACFGGCKLYNPKWKDNLYALCNQDIDRNGVMAEDACEECGKCVEDKKNTAGQEVLVGGCTPPDEATKACNMEPWNHVYGGCETYHPEHADENFPYCAEDKNEAGVAAKDACAECGSCYLVPTASPVGDSTPADVAPATPQPGSPVPPPTLDPNKPVCKFYDKKNPFDACFGECKLYNPTYKDNFYSYCGQDIDRNGVFAEDACEECGKCVEDKKNTAGQEVLIGGCKPPDSPEKPCDDKEPWPGSGYGSCETYHPDHESENFFYCLNDIASNGISAADACSQCGVCFESESTSDRARRGERVGAP